VFDLQHRKPQKLDRQECDLTQAQSILMLGAFWESQHPILLLHLRQWAGYFSHKLDQISFIREDFGIPSLSQDVAPIRQWGALLQSWIEKTDKDSALALINVQTLNLSQESIDALCDILQSHHIAYCLLGLEGPLKQSDFNLRNRRCGTIEGIITLHMEPQDWTQDWLMRQAVELAQAYVAFSAVLPSAGVKEGQICIPIAAPLEYQGTYESLWSTKPLTIEKVIAAPVGVLSFEDLMYHWLEQAPAIAHVRTISLRSQTPEALGSVLTSQREVVESFHGKDLIIMKNAMALNMILRRSQPLLDTPTALAQRGFWVSPDCLMTSCHFIVVSDEYGQQYRDRVSVCHDLPPDTVLYWSGLKSCEPCFGVLCHIIEEIV